MKKMLILSLLLIVSLAFTACRGDDAADGGLVTVTIPHYKVGDNAGAQYFLPIVEGFNQRYEGRFHLIIEELPQDMYTSQLRLLAPAGLLPALVEGALDDTWFEEIIIGGNLFTDLRPHFRNLPVYQYFNPINYQHNLTADGRLITVPNPIQRPMTMFYNEALWQPSRPIAEMSWMDVARDLGSQRIAFMTADNSWTTVLALTSMIAAEPGGVALLNGYMSRQERMSDLNHPAIIGGFTTLQYLMSNHAQDNVIGANFSEAANAFFNHNAAIICNGPWMIGDLGPAGAAAWHGPDFRSENVRASTHPGNIALLNPIGYNWWIPNTVSEAEQELALHFLGYMFSLENMEFKMTIAGGLIPGFNYSQAFLNARAEDRIMSEYTASITPNTTIVAPFFDVIVPSVAYDIGALLPLLIDGSMSPTDFVAELTRRTIAAS